MHQTLQLDAIGSGPHEIAVEHRGWRAKLYFMGCEHAPKPCVLVWDGGLETADPQLQLLFRPIPDEEYDGPRDGEATATANGGS